jgi:hypothetical protein
MQIRNKIIYPALLMLFMGLYFSSNAMACGGPDSPPCPVPPSIEAVPNAADFITEVSPAPLSDFPPLPDGTDGWNLSDDVLEERLTTLKKLDRQILTTAKLIITGLDEGSTTHTHLALEALVEMLAERDDINSTFMERFKNNPKGAVESQYGAYVANEGSIMMGHFIMGVSQTTDLDGAKAYFDFLEIQYMDNIIDLLPAP